MVNCHLHFVQNNILVHLTSGTIAYYFKQMSVTERTLIRFLSWVFLKNAGGAQSKEQREETQGVWVGGKSDLKKFLIDFPEF